MTNIHGSKLLIWVGVHGVRFNGSFWLAIRIPKRYLGDGWVQIIVNPTQMLGVMKLGFIAYHFTTS